MLDLVDGTARARVRHHPDGIELIRRALCFENARYLVRRVVPNRDDRTVTFFFFEEASRVFFGNFCDLFFRIFDDLILLAGNFHIEYGRRKRRKRGIMITALFDRVEYGRSLGSVTGLETCFDDLRKMLFPDRARTLDRLDKLGCKFQFQIIFGSNAFDKVEILRHAVVVDNSADRGLDDARHFQRARRFVFGDADVSAHRIVGFLFRPTEIFFVRQRKIFKLTGGKFDRAADVNFVLTVRFFQLITHQRFVKRREHGRNVFLAVFIGLAERIVFLALFPANNGQIIRADNHILRRTHDRFPVRKFQDIICGKH